MSLIHAKHDAALAEPPIDLEAPAEFQTATFSLG